MSFSAFNFRRSSGPWRVNPNARPFTPKAPPTVRPNPYGAISEETRRQMEIEELLRLGVPRDDAFATVFRPQRPYNGPVDPAILGPYHGTYGPDSFAVPPRPSSVATGASPPALTPSLSMSRPPTPILTPSQSPNNVGASPLLTWEQVEDREWMDAMFHGGQIRLAEPDIAPLRRVDTTYVPVCGWRKILNEGSAAFERAVERNLQGTPFGYVEAEREKKRVGDAEGNGGMRMDTEDAPAEGTMAFLLQGSTPLDPLPRQLPGTPFKSVWPEMERKRFQGVEGVDGREGGSVRDADGHAVESCWKCSFGRKCCH